jgi:hypothetical protein
VAHACAKNGHINILLKLLDFCPELCEIEDFSGNLPIHSLCWNTASSEEHLLIMLFKLVEKHEPSIRATNSRGKTPFQTLATRLCKDEDSVENPYETNKDAMDKVYKKMEQLEIVQE